MHIYFQPASVSLLLILKLKMAAATEDIFNRCAKVYACKCMLTCPFARAHMREATYKQANALMPHIVGSTGNTFSKTHFHFPHVILYKFYTCILHV